MHYILARGTIITGAAPVQVGAVLGSDALVTLWNRESQIGGATQFVLPRTSDPRCATAVYGNAAIAGLLRDLAVADAPDEWEAQIFGAGEPSGDGAHVHACVAVARSVLGRAGVRIASEDVGGELGRKLIVDLGTGMVMTWKVRDLRATDWSTDLVARPRRSARDRARAG